MPWKAAGAQVVETIKDTPVIKDVIPEEAKKDLLSGDPVKMITSAAVNPINFVQTAVNEPKKMGKSVEKAAAPAKKALKTGVKEVQKLAKKISKGRLF